jgi:hypothetical protein
VKAAPTSPLLRHCARGGTPMRKLSAVLFVSTIVAGCGVGDIADPPGEASGAADVSDCGCPEDSVCMDLNVLEGAEVRAGRVAVLWYQLNDVDPDPTPEIGYDAPLERDAQRLVIRHDDIRPPRSEALSLCERACADESTCPCRGETNVSIATVITADDGNGDGRLDVREALEGRYGRGYFVIVRSEGTYRTAPPPFDAVFAGAIHGGTHAYGFVASGDGSTVLVGNPEDLGDPEGVGNPEERARLVMNLCASPASRVCTPPFPTIRTF